MGKGRHAKAGVGTPIDIPEFRGIATISASGMKPTLELKTTKEEIFPAKNDDANIVGKPLTRIKRKPQKRAEPQEESAEAPPKAKKKKEKVAKKTKLEEVEVEGGYVPGALSSFLGYKGTAKDTLFDKAPASKLNPNFPPKPKKEAKEECASDEEEEQPRPLKRKANPEEFRRTLFVGNLPTDISKATLRTKFTPFGKIDTIRIRNIAAPDGSHLPKKAALIKKKLHDNCQRLSAYVKFVEPGSVQAALSMNGELIGGRHAQVDTVTSQKAQVKGSQSVFVGNLDYKADEEEVLAHFASCGAVAGVRLVRDGRTAVGKGFGFVTFKDAAAVALALRLNGEKMGKRQLRVTQVHAQASKSAGKAKSGMGKKKTLDKSRVSVNVGDNRPGATGPSRVKRKQITKKRRASQIKTSKKSLMS